MSSEAKGKPIVQKRTNEGREPFSSAEELEAVLTNLVEGCAGLAELRDGLDEGGVAFAVNETEPFYRKIFGAFESLRRLPLTPEEKSLWQDAQDELLPARGPKTRALASLWCDRARAVFARFQARKKSETL